MRIAFTPVTATLLCALLLAVPTHAQLAHLGPAGVIQLSKSLPPYDVSTVRINDEGADSASMSISDSSDTATATNATIEMLLESTFDIKADRIVGLSGPVTSAHFDLHAKVLPKDDGNPPKLTDQQLQAMLVPLLTERFHLKVHIEPRIMPVYELVVARGGPKLKLSTDPVTGTSTNMSGENAQRTITTKHASMADLAQVLSGQVHREVVDKTGLTGHADITLKWTEDEAADAGAPVLSIFTALQEQLGLRLVSTKGPVDTLVIDHIELPTEN